MNRFPSEQVTLSHRKQEIRSETRPSGKSTMIRSSKLHIIGNTLDFFRPIAMHTNCRSLIFTFCFKRAAIMHLGIYWKSSEISKTYSDL